MSIHHTVYPDQTLPFDQWMVALKVGTRSDRTNPIYIDWERIKREWVRPVRPLDKRG